MPLTVWWADMEQKSLDVCQITGWIVDGSINPLVHIEWLDGNGSRFHTSRVRFVGQIKDEARGVLWPWRGYFKYPITKNAFFSSKAPPVG